MSVCVCMCASNISADQDQTDLRFSTWLLHGSRVCNVAFVWTIMIPLINYFRNALRIPLALLAIATIVTCTPEPITAELTPTTYLKKQVDLGCTGSRVGRKHPTNTVNPGLNLAGGPVLHVTPPPIALPFPVYPLSNKGVYASKKSLKETSGFIPAVAQAGLGFCRRFSPVLCI